MSGNVYSTGFEELDRKLAGLEPKVQKKYGRTALNNAVKIVEAKFKELVPVDTGAMRDAVVRRTPKGKRGQMRRALMITRDSLARVIKKQTKSKEKITIGDNDFYPAYVELGTQDREGKRPLRDALYGNEGPIRAEFVKELRKIVTEAEHG